MKTFFLVMSMAYTGMAIFWAFNDEYAIASYSALWMIFCDMNYHFKKR